MSKKYKPFFGADKQSFGDAKCEPPERKGSGAMRSMTDFRVKRVDAGEAPYRLAVRCDYRLGELYAETVVDQSPCGRIIHSMLKEIQEARSVARELYKKVSDASGLVSRYSWLEE